jgi:hypothetical protein
MSIVGGASFARQEGSPIVARELSGPRIRASCGTLKVGKVGSLYTSRRMRGSECSILICRAEMTGKRHRTLNVQQTRRDHRILCTDTLSTYGHGKGSFVALRLNEKWLLGGVDV